MFRVARSRTRSHGSSLRAVLATTLFCVACVTAPRAGSPPRGYIVATRAKADCGSERACTASWTLADTIGLQRPLARTLVLPPLPFPPGFEQARIELRVSEDGDVIPDSVWIDGASDRAFETRLRQTVRAYKYWPAVLDGCAVAARTMSRVGRSSRRQPPREHW